MVYWEVGGAVGSDLCSLIHLSREDPCVCVFVRVHGPQRRAWKLHSRLPTLLFSEGWDWEAEQNFTQILTLLYCLACFHEQNFLKHEQNKVGGAQSTA